MLSTTKRSTQTAEEKALFASLLAEAEERAARSSKVMAEAEAELEGFTTQLSDAEKRREEARETLEGIENELKELESRRSGLLDIDGALELEEKIQAAKSKIEVVRTVLDRVASLIKNAAAAKSDALARAHRARASLFGSMSEVSKFTEEGQAAMRWLIQYTALIKLSNRHFMNQGFAVPEVADSHVDLRRYVNDGISSAKENLLAGLN